MATRPLPPLDGSVPVIPGFVDFHAEHNADEAWATFPSRSKPGEYEYITFAEFAKATHRVAHHIRPQRNGKDGEVVAMLIHCDSILYVAVLTGLIRAGVVPLPISPRNSAEAVANLMEKTGSHRLIVTDALAQTATGATDMLEKRGYSVQMQDLIRFDKVFPTLSSPNDASSSDVGPYPASDGWPKQEDVVLILHSSGSTGLPKPIPMTRQVMFEWATNDHETRAHQLGIAYGGMALPSFHTMGIFQQLLYPVTSGTAVGFYTPQYPAPPVVPTAENYIEALRACKCTGVVTVPSILESWAQDPDAVSFLATMKVVTFAGGPLSTANGTKLIKAGVPIQCTYGLTEAGAPVRGYFVDDSQGPDAPWKTSADWEWIEFSPKARIRWDPQGDGSFELQLLTCDTHHPSIENLPDVKGYATSDLWVPHPTKEGLWRMVGRKDDVLVLGTGEKIVPIPQENHIISSPLVAGVVMLGWGRTQPAVLIEPAKAYAVDADDEAGLTKYRNLIWPVVEEANHLGPTFARLFKETIILAKPSKPFPRAAKGTTQRKQALALYAEEIEQLYKTLDESSDSGGISPPKSWSAEDLQVWLVEHVSSLNNNTAPAVDADLFASGFDSLSATILRNRLLGALRSSQEPAVQTAVSKVNQNFVFDHPTITKLAHAIAALVDPSAEAAPDRDPAEEIVQFIDKYSKDWPKRAGGPATRSEGIVVLLTGSTGNLGCHILATLLSDERVSKVYTLDRASAKAPPNERIRAAFEDRGLPSDLLSGSKLVTLLGDLNAPQLGLDEGAYTEVHNSVTHAVHNAWSVNFNYPLSSFETHISGTRHLADFCLTAKHGAKLLFTSSVSVAHGWDGAKGPVPEEPLPEPAVATKSGYASSKYVVEQILAKASAHGLSATSLRIGQVCGSKTTGAWNTTDWVPSLVKSSVTLGCLPDLSTPVDWIPMDVVSGAALDIICGGEHAFVVNVVHPRPVAGKEVSHAISTALSNPPLPVVSFNEWLQKLRSRSEGATARDLEAVPAIHLLDFFEGVARSDGLQLTFSTDVVQRLSGTVKNVEPLDEAYAKSWIRYWRSSGFLA